MKIDSDSREVTMSWVEAMVMVNAVLQGIPDNEEALASVRRCIQQFIKFALSKGDSQQDFDVNTAFADVQVLNEGTAN